jgi:phospholipase C
MIEWRWGLLPLSVRDATANNLADVLDLGAQNLQAPAMSVAPFIATSCRASFAAR